MRMAKYVSLIFMGVTVGCTGDNQLPCEAAKEVLMVARPAFDSKLPGGPPSELLVETALLDGGSITIGVQGACEIPGIRILSQRDLKPDPNAPKLIWLISARKRSDDRYDYDFKPDVNPAVRRGALMIFSSSGRVERRLGGWVAFEVEDSDDVARLADLANRSGRRRLALDGGGAK